LGVYLGKLLISTGVASINPTLLLSGMDDMLKNKSRLISDSTIVLILNNYQESKQKQIGENIEEQFFVSLKDKSGVGKLPTGVQFTILRAGTGIRPSQNDSIEINCKVVLANGTVFEDTYTKQIAIAPRERLCPG
jgi:FKBP-type peptidyl-prolyl cis-trans isomerase FklB